MNPKATAAKALGLAALVLLATGGRAAAEPVLVGRILIGGPSDNGVDTGFGNYPGGNGFVPGYGNAPDYSDSPQLVINFYRWRQPPAELGPPDAAPAPAPAPEPARRWRRFFCPRGTP